jgi:hypothetical protein
MNSRRFMSGPKHRRHHLIGSNEHFDRGQTRHQNHCRSAQPMSEMGQKPALPRRSIDVRFAPNKQTLTERVQCDAMCHYRTLAVQQTALGGL